MTSNIETESIGVGDYTADVEYTLGAPEADAGMFDIWCSASSTLAKNSEVKCLRYVEPFKSKIDKLLTLSDAVGINFKEGVNVCSTTIN